MEEGKNDCENGEASHDSSRFTEIRDSLQSVLSKIDEISSQAGKPKARLVAVSKTKPVEDLLAAYEAGQRHFGENYAQELIDKSPQCPDDMRFHFIGHLQSNKARPLVTGVPNLYVVETVDSPKLAKALEKACISAGREELNIFLQINTSQEAQKSGIPPEECIELAQYVVSECPHLSLKGLMTIGKFGDVSPEYFQCLIDCRDQVCQSLGLETNEIELSMGMSGDLELALQMGSTNIRVGSTIFGARNYPAKS
mmetsp:Transcript_24750/g.32322  ORF Transcript_24750/g.32322 Transcript_24750/m.32322 type:complete len:254 (-) Transcript_24750:105-866(-)